MLTRDGDPPFIELRGEIDFVHASLVRAAVDDLMGRGCADLHICCSDLHFLDSSGVSALVYAWKRAGAAGGRVYLVKPSDNLLRVLRITGLSDCFQIAGTEFETKDPEGEDLDGLEFVIAADPEAVASVRHQVSAVARTMPFTDEQIEDINLAVGEAVTNAVRYGSPNGVDCRIAIRCRKLPDGLSIRVTDEGCGFDPKAVICLPPDRLVEGGRGLFFMRILMDEVNYSFKEGTSVRMVKRLANT